MTIKYEAKTHISIYSMNVVMPDLFFMIPLQHIQKKANDWGVKMEVIAGKKNKANLFFFLFYYSNIQIFTKYFY